jgi:HlyD family secretion protein
MHKMTENTSSNNPSLQQLKINRQSTAAGKKSISYTRWLSVLVIALILVVYLFKPSAQEVQLSSVVTTYPSQQYAQLSASGYVVAQRRAAVASKATGRLIWLNVREGSKVKQGEIIAKLDSSDVQAAMAAVQANIRQAEAGVAQANVELVNAESDLQRAQGLKNQGFLSAQAMEAAT